MSRPNFDRLAPPPRTAGLELRLYTLFAEPFGQVGWVLVAFGSIFFWAFAMNADATSWLVFRGDPPTALGTVTGVGDTRARENGQRVWTVAYSFRAGDGALRQGTSYVSGTAPKVGERVTVEFVEARPEVSRIQGMRRAMFGPGALFVSLFPGLGCLMVVFAFRSGRHKLRLLVEGKVASGKLVSREGTNVRVNRRPVVKLTYEFAADDGQRHRAVARTSLPEELTDEAREALLYLPDAPERAVLVDDLPKGVTADEMGELHLSRPALAVMALVLPLFTVLGNTACAVLRSSR